MMGVSKILARQLGHPSGWVSYLAAYVWNKRNRALNEAALAALALHPADRVLEVGFGGGYLLGRVAATATEGFVAGVDVSAAMVARVTSRYRALIRAGKLTLQCAPAEALPFPAGAFTKVCTVNSLFYWQDVPRAFAESWRVLTPRGCMVICFTLKTSLQSRGFARHIGLYEVSAIEAMLAASGFQDIRTERTADRYREFVCITSEKPLRADNG